MGLLDQLLQQLKDAAEDQRNQPIPGSENPSRAPANRARARAQSAAAKEVTSADAAAHVPHNDNNPGGEDPVHRLVADSAAATVLSSRRITHPLLARLRTPNGMREAVIMAELLRRPGRR